MKNATNWIQNGRSYSMDQAMSGHWRLLLNGVIMLEDSAFEDYHQFDSAKASFMDYINDYEAEIIEFERNNK